MPGEVFRFEDTTVQTLSGQRVGISRVMDDDLPDPTGRLMRQPSARLTIIDIKTNQPMEHKTVVIGSVVEIGSDRYCIESIEVDAGWISLRQLGPG